MLFKMILREECNVGARLLGWCSRDRCTPWENTNQEPPTDFTDAHRSGGYGIPAIPTQPLNYLPTEATEPNHLWASVKSWEALLHQKFL